MEWTAITRFLAGQWFLADVGNIHYCMWNTLHGRFMYSPLTSCSHFAYHFTPLLVVLSPISLLSSYPVPLVTCYTLGLAACVFPIHALCWQKGLRAAVSVALAFCFIANHFVGSIELAAHFEVFFILLFLCCMAARPDSWWFWVWGALTLAVKEDAAVWLGAWCVFEWFRTRHRSYAVLGVTAVVYLVAAGACMVVVARVGHVAGTGWYAQRTGGVRLGWDIGVNVAALLASFALLPLAAGRTALLLIPPAAVLFVNFDFMRQLQYYYSYPILPFLVYASVEGASRLVGAVPQAKRQSEIAVAAALVVAGLIQFVLPTRTDGLLRVPVRVTSRDRYRVQIARDLVPRQAPVAIQFGLWGVTPTVPGAQMLGPQPLPADMYVFLDLKAAYGMPRDEFIALVRPVFADAEEGRRRLLYRQHDIFIISPVHMQSAPRGLGQ